MVQDITIVGAKTLIIGTNQVASGLFLRNRKWAALLLKPLFDFT